ncbi:TPA: DUF957 domain-containing protein [Salmonella enterica subsp. enterica serovar Typhimurium]|uniref:DUF957 domain-containing protein n=6 Tax=Enterobacterales TaxID=91347 RepID=A0A3Y5ZHM4_SALSE|nr:MULTISPECIES: DUF957 domain-containing protein [Enterobacterales]EAA5838259.1 DUF957 domain-containing protein [Salmonella enterica subsp. enterica serovar Tennessee]EAA8711796.1 DUF957 domain-containing protein [Salmonella enterica subsp. enterica serovar Derby]EAY3298899.1 DUF957 domain-containing protein [Salmonella enterica subsp. enterica serovar Dublin]EBL5388535.1 DUF957 domain-containing protein [Salmonella enterica subsp. enterica serovar Kentucky]EBN3470332.1 DUF957 domain-contain
MPLTTEEGLQILICWLQDNIDCGTEIIFDNDDTLTDSATLLPSVEQALNEVRMIHYLRLLLSPQ